MEKNEGKCVYPWDKYEEQNRLHQIMMILEKNWRPRLLSEATLSGLCWYKFIFLLMDFILIVSYQWFYPDCALL